MFDDDIGWRSRAVAMDDYLLSLDFVVVGEVEDHPISSLSRVRVQQVILGALPHDHVVIGLPPEWRGQRVLAWGTWDGARGDTCFGNGVEVRSDGGMTAQAIFQLDGESVERPGMYERILARLEQRADEHPANWLASGNSVALMSIAGPGKSPYTMALGGGRTLLGPATVLPRTARWPRRPCHFAVGLPGDSILLALPAESTEELEIPVCPARLHFAYRPSYRTPFGVTADHLGLVLHSDGTRFHIQRIHGVVEPAVRW